MLLCSLFASLSYALSPSCLSVSIPYSAYQFLLKIEKLTIFGI